MRGACWTEEKTETGQSGRDRNAQGAGEESARPGCGDSGVQGGRALRADQLLTVMLRMGEAMIDCGAEILRVEDTLNRIGFAYGACSMNVFVITSSIVITMEYAPGLQCTQTKRIRGTVGNDMTELEALNELSREICTGQPPVEEFQRRLREVLPRENARISFLHDAPYHAVLRKRASLASEECADAGMRAQGQDPGRQRYENSRSGEGLYARKRIVSLTGYVLAAGAFAVFFGGTALDGLMAAAAGALTWFFVETISPLCMNQIMAQLILSFLSGLTIALLTRLVPTAHMDKIMIGDIMLLVPGIMFTNAIRDMLLGDTLSGLLRFCEAVLLAGMMAMGFIAAIWLAGQMF